MSRTLVSVLAALSAVPLPGCRAEETHVARLRLPRGDAAAGKEAFVALGCHNCHAVVGVVLPTPVAAPPAPGLGNPWPVPPSEERLLASILDPSHDINRLFPERMTQDPTGHSRMGDFSRVMTVRQLVDIAAFLEQSYGAKHP